MRFRKLRIAWSLAWGLLAVLLCVLWVRSYWWNEALQLAAFRHVLIVESVAGQMTFDAHRILDLSDWLASDRWQREVHAWHYNSQRRRFSDDVYHFNQERGVSIVLTPDFDWSAQVISLPIWLFVVLASISAVSPWLRHIPYRFSLRTLLIATTLVAV